MSTMTQPPIAPLPLEYRAPSTGMMSARKWLAWLNVLGTFAALLVIYGFFCVMAPRSFPRFDTVETLLRQITIVGIASMGMTLIMICGGIDLSVGSMVALVVVVIAWTIKQGYNPWMAAFAGIATGALCGAVNGLLITTLRVVPFIVTLGMLEILRGLALRISHQQPIYIKPMGLDALTERLGSDHRWMVFPSGVWIMFALVALTAFVLRYTRFGRHVVAVGSNEQTARLCGIPVQRVKVTVYMLGGALVGVAGLMQFSRLTIGDPTAANGLELSVVAAVDNGGASLSGGQGSALGSLIGAAIMATISMGGSHLGWETSSQRIITGTIIIVAVAVDQLRHRRAMASQGD